MDYINTAKAIFSAQGVPKRLLKKPAVHAKYNKKSRQCLNTTKDSTTTNVHKNKDSLIGFQPSQRTVFNFV